MAIQGLYEYLRHGISGLLNNRMPPEIMQQIRGKGYELTVNQHFMELYPASVAQDFKHGWKFHLSINPDDTGRALDIVFDELSRQGHNAPFKVVNDKKNREFGDPHSDGAGKNITIYSDDNHERLMKIMQSIEDRLQQERAVFGAFVLGLAMPRGRLSELTAQRLEPVVVNLLLPMFFVFSGLNTRITLIDSWMLWLVAGVILIAACAGKGLACYAAARGNGENKRDAVAIGALMNARGLMELIILNIGLERGIVTPALFSIIVLMAIVTTLMATPIFEWALRVRGGVPELSGERS